MFINSKALSTGPLWTFTGEGRSNVKNPNLLVAKGSE